MVLVELMALLLIYLFKKGIVLEFKITKDMIILWSFIGLTSVKILNVCV